MHVIQEKLLSLAKKTNLASMTLRGMAKEIGLPDEPPQKIKHHLLQLQRKGFLTINREKGTMTSVTSGAVVSQTRGANSSPIFSIPIIGSANCGEPSIFAEQNYQGFLRVSARLVGRQKPHGLFAIRADGSSMNRAEIDGRRLEDGDFAIIDSNSTSPKDGDVVLAVIDGKATIKRLINDRENEQVVLKADSSFDYEPIYLHEEDGFVISGKVIAVIKRPKM